MSTEQPTTPAVDVWFAKVGEARDRWVLERVRGLLDPWEEERLDRLALDDDKIRFAATHGLVRALLSSLRPVETSGWRLGSTSEGKPYVSAPAPEPGIHISLSHSRGLVGCVAASFPVGLDVEDVTRKLDIEGLAPRTMTPREIARWRQFSAASAPRSFLRHWTLKEALLKAMGVGLGVSPLHLEVSPVADGEAGIIRVPGDFGEACDWCAYGIEPLASHVAAVAVKAPVGSVAVRWRLVDLEQVLTLASP